MSFYCNIKYELLNSSLNLEFNLLNNDILYLQGANASGKTTAFNIINGFISPIGIIQLNGITLFDSSKKINILPKNRNIARVFQNYSLFPNMNVAKNLDFASKNKQLLDYLIEKLEVKPLLSKNIGALSGGQQQKVAIMQSLISSPQLLLLDEAFTNLDTTTKRIIKEIIKDVKIPVILTSHNTEDTTNFITKTIVIDN
ncbi:MAG: ATP-binding cassette domain-containing protein [Alphaproteobacteria bacterium]|jgi:ABC-type molybdate transport system ATPase subunit|nr:ATP-binding cassette domain-containing protein [Alphaproteobacteria bacterium]